MRSVLLPLVLVLSTTAAALVSVERGNRLFRAGKYAEAVEVYRAALEQGKEGPVLRYNLGTALLKLGRFEEADEHLRAALDAVDPDVREWVHYNLGHRYLEDARQSQDPQATGALYDAAVEAYRQALRLRPDDADAKWNYELALQEREEQQSGGGGGDDEDQDQDQDEQPGDEGQGGSGPGSSQPSDATPSPGDEGERSPMSREQAERILSAMEQDERELFRDKLRKGQQQTRTARDW